MNLDIVGPQFGSWAEKLAPFITSPEFDEIFTFLKKEARGGKVICPQSKDVFRAFKECEYSKCKAVFFLQDPYPWIKNGKFVADGIPMSCSNTHELQPSLSLFYDGMEDNLGKKVGRNADLTYLCHQGILILNTSLTVELNKPSSHKEIWSKFMNYLIDEVLNLYSTGLCVVAFGKHGQLTAKSMMPLLHWTFDVEHPAAAAHKQRKWDHGKIFTGINTVLKNNQNDRIIWDYNDYYRYLESIPKIATVNEHIKEK